MNLFLKANFAVISALVFVLSSCENDNREDLTKKDECPTENITFGQHVQPILLAKCSGCHGMTSPEAGISLVGYDNVIKLINSGRLLGAINHSNGFSPMPKNSPKLPKCEIDQIESWVNGGSLNN